MTRILITGFGPFPGAPSNPSMRLATHLGRVKRVRYSDVTRIVRLLPTTWDMLEGIGRVIAELEPDVILMFGVAGRRRHVTPERRALNRNYALRPDAQGAFAQHAVLTKGARFAQDGGINASRMVVRMRGRHVPAKTSNSAGDYLCNALFWRASESGLPCIFVHVPRPRRMMRPKGHASKHPRPSLRQMELAAEIALESVLLEIRRASAQ